MFKFLYENNFAFIYQYIYNITIGISTIIVYKPESFIRSLSQSMDHIQDIQYTYKYIMN